MDYSQVDAVINKFKELFFKPDGIYYWFFDMIRLAHQAGSYLFVHAGMDDVIARLISEQGIDAVNREFEDYLAQNPFALYHAPMGNAFRTKYRDSDYFFSEQAAQLLHKKGIYAIVHGHRNTYCGQRVVIREGMLNFECNATIDRNTRVEEGLSGPGGAVVVFETNGYVKGISTDYPFIKEFHPG